MGKPWTEREFNHAKKLKDSGISCGEIASALGRTAKSVSTKLSRPTKSAYISSPSPYTFEGGLSGQALIEARRKAYRVHEERRPGETLADCQRRLG